MIFLDSSALLKRYREEPGSAFVDDVLGQDLDWAASELARSEVGISICRRMEEGPERMRILQQLGDDWRFVLAVPIDSDCLLLAHQIGCEHGVRTLDAIHLAAAKRIPGDTRFLTFDERQKSAAAALGLPVIVATGDRS